MKNNNIIWDSPTGCELYAGFENKQYADTFHGHNHNWNLLQLHSGDAEITINGRKLKLNPGYIFLIPPHTPRYFRHQKGWKLHWLHFNLDAHLQYAPEWQKNEADIMYIHPSAKELPRFEKLFEEILELCRLRSIGWYRLAYCLIQEIILRGNMISQKGLDPEHLEFAAKILADVSDLKVGDIAKKCGLSRTAFFKKFKETFGVTPTVYREQLLLNQVRTELEQSNCSIKEIAEKMQFKSEFYLSARFKKMFGISPFAYRRQFRETALKK